MAKAEDELAKIRKELAVDQEGRRKDRAKMDKALENAMSKSAGLEKKDKACEDRAGALEKKLAEANKRLKDAESKAAKLAEENQSLKDGSGPR